MRNLLWAMVAVLVLAGCMPRFAEKPGTNMVPTGWSELPGWPQDTVEEAWPAWQESCRVLSQSPRSRPTWGTVCETSLTVDPTQPGAVRAYFERNFVPHRVVVVDDKGRTDEGLVTGYYEPLLRASRTRNDQFRFPVYARPNDLLTIDLTSLYPELAGKRLRGRVVGNKVVPYYSREALSAKDANVDADVLVWLDDEMDVFFLQIQGSGRAVLPDGSRVRIGYADQNGHPYKAIAGVLIQWGEMTRDQASMQAIRKWVRDHPERSAELLNKNPSYVFFRELPPPTDPLDVLVDGPIGALGVPLLAGRSIAIDRNQLPLGAPVFLATTLPDNTPWRRLVMAQDTGGAIRGALRADFYFGTGDQAGKTAGGMRQRGQFWVLMPK